MPTFPFNYIPKELKEKILEKLEIIDLLWLFRVNKSMRNQLLFDGIFPNKSIEKIRIDFYLDMDQIAIYLQKEQVLASTDLQIGYRFAENWVLFRWPLNDSYPTPFPHVRVMDPFRPQNPEDCPKILANLFKKMTSCKKLEISTRLIHWMEKEKGVREYSNSQSLFKRTQFPFKEFPIKLNYVQSFLFDGPIEDYLTFQTLDLIHPIVTDRCVIYSAEEFRRFPEEDEILAKKFEPIIKVCKHTSIHFPFEKFEEILYKTKAEMHHLFFKDLGEFERAIRKILSQKRETFKFSIFQIEAPYEAKNSQNSEIFEKFDRKWSEMKDLSKIEENRREEILEKVRQRGLLLSEYPISIFENSARNLAYLISHLYFIVVNG